MNLPSERNPINQKQIQPKRKLSQWSLLINTLVRPPRMVYNQSQAGMKKFYVRDQQYNRTDQMLMHQGKKINLTIFNPEQRNKKIILYLHGNSSSKLQSKGLLPYLPHQISLASFDFIGCGNNMEQQYITLGHDQSKQVQTVVNYLKSQNYKVILWGRSMGAASALMYGKADAIVADSPFRNFKKLCKQLSKSKINPLPNFLVSCLFPCVFMKLKSDIKKIGHYDIDQLDIEKAIKNINPSVTLIFMSGKQDQLIHFSNSQKLYNLFEGKNKYLQLVPGNHNSKRPEESIIKIMRILDFKTQQSLQRSDTTSKYSQPLGHQDGIHKQSIQLKVIEHISNPILETKENVIQNSISTPI